MAEAWVRGPMLGRGSFATVYLATTLRHQKLVAVKSCELSRSASLRWEKEVLQDLGGCPNIISCYSDGVTVEEDGRRFYNVVVEYVEGGSLKDLISSRGPLPEAVTRRYLRSTLVGLRHLHEKGYVHCDVKVHNLLLIESGGRREVKLADFGLAKKCRGSCAQSNNSDGEATERQLLRGTPLYMAPESVAENEYEPPSDVWALGCLLVEMVTGKPAWKDENLGPLLMRIGVGDELPETPEELSEQGKDFLAKCFVKDPTKRWTAEMLLCHPFIASIDELPDVEFSPSPRTILDFPSWVSPRSTPGSISSPVEDVVEPVRRLRQLATWEAPDWDCHVCSSSTDDGCWITVREAECSVSGRPDHGGHGVTDDGDETAVRTGCGSCTFGSCMVQKNCTNFLCVDRQFGYR